VAAPTTCLPHLLVSVIAASRPIPATPAAHTTLVLLGAALALLLRHPSSPAFPLSFLSYQQLAFLLVSFSFSHIHHHT
jgi:hypothetical protein